MIGMQQQISQLTAQVEEFSARAAATQAEGAPEPAAAEGTPLPSITSALVAHRTAITGTGQIGTTTDVAAAAVVAKAVDEPAAQVPEPAKPAGDGVDVAPADAPAEAETVPEAEAEPAAAAEDEAEEPLFGSDVVVLMEMNDLI